MDEDRLKKASQLAKVATEMDMGGDYETAFEFYKSSLDHWSLVCKYQTNPALKERLYKKMEAYITRAEEIKKYLEAKQQSIVEAADGVDGYPRSFLANGSNNTSQNGSKENERLKNLLSGVVLVEKPDISWKDVAGLEVAKEALQEAVTLPAKFPGLFTGDRRPWKGILLFGPPGTGKTHLAKACATEASAAFLSVSSADLISKWQGESEKLVRALFEMARQRSPAVVFVDEIDSLCGARHHEESESSRRVKTEFLVQMEGLEKGGDETALKRILILGATNTPWTLDAAFRRRFERRIFIPLPDLHARKQMFKIHIGKTAHSLMEGDFVNLAERTEGYSGADISVLVRDALFEPVRKCRLATHFKQIQNDAKQYWTPCSPGDTDPSKEERSLMSIPSHQLFPPDLSMWDFEVVLPQTKPSIGPEELQMHRDWTAKYGVEGQ